MCVCAYVSVCIRMLYLHLLGLQCSAWWLDFISAGCAETKSWKHGRFLFEASFWQPLIPFEYHWNYSNLLVLVALNLGAALGSELCDIILCCARMLLFSSAVVRVVAIHFIRWCLNWFWYFCCSYLFFRVVVGSFQVLSAQAQAIDMRENAQSILP